MTAPRPKGPETELKSAAQLFWLYAFLLALSLGIVVALAESDFDRVGVVIFCGLGVYLLLLVLAGFLLFRRRKAGSYLGWALLPVILLSVPIGTIVGVVIITKITNPEVKALLS